MKYFKRLIILTAATLLFLLAAGCSSKTNSDYKPKDLLSADDFVQLLTKEGLKLSDKRTGKSTLDVLQQKSNTIYIIDGDKTKEVAIYVFSSEAERKKAKAEFDGKVVAATMPYHNLHEVKNIMVIIYAGDQQNEYYSRAASAMEKLKAQ